MNCCSWSAVLPLGVGINCAFAQWLNRRRERIGPLFAGRPISREVPPQHAFELIAWIHNAPVREHLAPRAAENRRGVTARTLDSSPFRTGSTFEVVSTELGSRPNQACLMRL
jgi:hypothetical protein